MRDIVFYLKGRPSGGGANSVVQEFTALVQQYGVGHLAVEPAHRAEYRRAYAWDDAIDARVVSDLAEVPHGAVAVATTNDSVGDLVSRRGSLSPARIYYYVQDFEPLFYAPSSRAHDVAHDSYAYANDVVAVVKTDWLRQMLLVNSFMPVVRIRPSIDRSRFYPTPGGMPAGTPVVAAMLRPSTPRRGTRRTVEVVNRLVAELGGQVQAVTFGCDADELRQHGLVLDAAVDHRGRLVAADAAEVVRCADVMLDLSDYQAFGRSVAEGMACGTVPVVTRHGAPPEFVADGVSGHLVDPGELDDVVATTRAALTAPAAEHAAMRAAAIAAVSEWGLEATAFDWLSLAADAG